MSEHNAPVEHPTHLPVFVYGTLLRSDSTPDGDGFKFVGGNWEWALREKTTRVVPGRVHHLALYAGAGFPFTWVTSDPKIYTRGEVHYIRQDIYSEVLESLDSLEGYRPTSPDGSLYLRRAVNVIPDTGDEDTISAYTYIAATPERVTRLPLLRDGDWRAEVKRRWEAGQRREALDELARYSNELGLFD